MKRSDAVEAIMGLPEVERIEKLTALQPKDVIVAYLNLDDVTLEESQKIQKVFGDVWPGQTVLVLDKNLRIKVLVGKEAVTVETPPSAVVALDTRGQA